MKHPFLPGFRRRAVTAAAGMLSASLVLAACGGSSGSSSAAPDKVSQADIDKAMKTPTDLTFWTWVPNIKKEVAVFEKKYPAIHVKVVNAGQGEPQYTKLRTALKAGSGAPDLAQIEFQYIPTFSITKSLEDLRPYGAEQHANTFVDWTWNQVKGSNGEIWAYPQDTGPMGMLYRKDIFDKYGHQAAEDLGRVRRRVEEAARGRPERLHDQPRGQPERRVDGPALAGGRQAVREHRRRLGEGLGQRRDVEEGR